MLAISLWLLIGCPATWWDLALRTIGGWLLLLGVALAGLWLALPLSTLFPLAVLMLLATAVAGWRAYWTPLRAGRPVFVWAARIAAVAVLALGGWLAVPSLAGRMPPQGAVDLRFPLKGGEYLVLNGGGSERVNGHMMTLEPRYATWRGESYAVDLVRVDGLGFRTHRRQLFASPQNPADYLSYGEPVYAPCAGLVEATMEERADMPVPVRDRKHIEGNFVRLRCGNLIAFLGHFRRGGVVVRTGDTVAAGTLLGQVGNSGNSDEPHLHVHLQRPAGEGSPLSGEPIHVTFDGRFPVRNMIFE
ncbi:MAG TPA: M23 family metallopeptidase [Allosphingosinicella sp.]